MKKVPTGNSRQHKVRDFVLGEEQFQQIAEIMGQHAGIVLSDTKKHLVYGRLVKRLRLLDLSGFDEYLELINSSGNEEFEHFVNALTTNLTSFFREPKHFEFLEKTLVPMLVQNKSEPVIRIWSAGCSTGEEPYSIAMSVSEMLPRDWSVRILATDLDSTVVAHARAGIYSSDRVSGISQDRLRRWFLQGKGSNSGNVRVKPEIAQSIAFKPLNLLHDWPFRQSFDVIFCRNVVIYFDKVTQAKLFDRFANVLAPAGHLFVGHSETLYKVTDRFNLLGNTIYRKEY